MTHYEVTAALVTVQTTATAPYGTAYVYRGGLLPDDAKPASIEHLLSLGMVRRLDELEEPR